MFVAHDGKLGEVERLISHGANVNAAINDGFTVLHCAVQNGHVDVAALLLDNDADIEARSKEGVTPLNTAAFSSQFSCVALLLDHGAKIDAVNNYGFTVLNRVAQEGNLAAVELLVKRGFDIERGEVNGQTPLMAGQRQREGDRWSDAVVDCERSGSLAHGRVAQGEWRKVKFMCFPLTFIFTQILLLMFYNVRWSLFASYESKNLFNVIF